MSRMRQAFERLFRCHLERLGARRLEQGIERLFARGNGLAERAGLAQPKAWFELWRTLDLRIARRRAPLPLSPPPLFLCDGGLGGLARWLWACGCEAEWRPRTPDGELVAEALRRQAILLTTDSLILERRVARDGSLQVLWLPPILPLAEQWRAVLARFQLQPGDPRCMDCGGELAIADKETHRDRIPPRTYRWLNEYFICTRCQKLFWHGTHWQRIQARLGAAHLVPPAYR